MTRRGLGFVHASAARVVAITATLWIMMSAAPARAQAVQTLITQLEADSEKVRLSAALNLTKLGDAKAILPMVKALQNDRSDTVRAAAAVGLAKLVTDATSKSMRGLAVKALDKASQTDASKLVKQQAAKSLASLGGNASGTGTGGPASSVGPSGGGGSGCYVHIGPMSAKTGDGTVDGKMRPLMVKTASKMMGKAAASMATTWAGGAAPTAAQLKAKGFAGFYVDGTLNELTVVKSDDGFSATISCKISMLLADFPNKSVFGMLKGAAKVQGSDSASDIAMGMDDCVAAVVEDLIAKKIIPTIKTKATCP